MKKTFKYLKKQRVLENIEQSVNENVLVVNDGELFKVNKVIDINKKLINALLKKAKEATGKDPRVFWNDVAIADEIVKYLIDNYLNIESLPESILIGDTNLEAPKAETVEEVPAEEVPAEEVPAEEESKEEEEEPKEEEPKEEEPKEEEEEEKEEVPSLDNKEEKEEKEEAEDSKESED